MSLFADLWEFCDSLSLDNSLSIRLFNDYIFKFKFSCSWPCEKIIKALSGNQYKISNSDNENKIWQIYALSENEYKLDKYLKNFSRNCHGKLGLKGGDDSSVAFYDSLHKVMRIYDFENLKCAIIVADKYEFSEWELHSPFQEFWHIWALKNGGLLIHSGVVCDGEKAILIPGAGGSGKSTTVVSCLENGLTTTGDDYNLLLKSGGDYLVTNLYSNFKMKLPLKFHFNILSGWQSEDLSYVKKRIYHPPVNSEIWNRRLPKLVAVLCPKTGFDETQITQVRNIELINKIAVSSVVQNTFMAKEYLSKASLLANQIGSANLNLSTDLSANVQSVKSYFEV